MFGQTYQITFANSAAEHIRELFGCDLAGAQLAAAAGALDGAQVEFSVRRPNELLVVIKHPYILEQLRSFRFDRDGNLYVYNEEFAKRPHAPAHLAARALWRQVQAAREIGCQWIETYAAGNPRSASRYGYYVWAALGFDAPLTLRERQSLSGFLVGAQTLNQLILRNGANWWRKSGSERKMIFDLTKGSDSERILLNYLKRKGITP